MACGADQAGLDTAAPGGGGGIDGAGAASDASAALVQSKVIVTSSLALQVKDLRGVYDQAAEITSRAGGFVAEASISDASESAEASMRLRVPAERHDEVIRSLRGLDGVSVDHEELKSEEVTAEYTDLSSHLVNLQRTEAQYQALLEQAPDVDAILSITSRLSDVRDEIEQTQGRMNLLDDLTDLATINLTLSEQGAAEASIPGPAEVFADALEVSLDAGRWALNLAVILVVAAIWLVPLAIAGRAAHRFGQRRFPSLFPPPR